MSDMQEQDKQLDSVKRNLTKQEFDNFEFQMSQARVRDLEAQLDKLLESTTNQREIIENFQEETASLKAKVDRL